MLEPLDPARLRVFREVANRRSFTAAANSLGISQPAVSQHVAQLERATGVVLVDRTTRRLRLTGPGQVVLRHANVVLQKLEDARLELSDLASAESNELRLITFPSGAATIVPPLVAALRAASPNATVQLLEADPQVALPFVSSGDADAALAYDYPLLAATRDPALLVQNLADDAMAVALPPGHPLAQHKSLTMRQLAGLAFVAPFDCACRDALAHAARRVGYSLDVASETNDYLSMLGLVTAGLGVAVVPRLIAPIAPSAVLLRPLEDPFLRRRMSLVTRRSGYSPEILTRLSQIAAELVPAFGSASMPLLVITEHIPNAAPPRRKLNSSRPIASGDRLGARNRMSSAAQFMVRAAGTTTGPAVGGV